MNNYIKLGLLGALIGIAALKPELASTQWRRLEKTLSRFAQRRLVCCLTMGALVLVVRLCLLPIWDPPKPYIYDEFGYLLQADTFTSGRLTNPTPALWQFFESPYLLMQPSYTSKYPPGQGFVLAAGQLLFHDPWFGVWLSCGLLMAVLCWAMQGWLSPGWALFGSFLALKLCLFSYWMDSYWGGALAAIGGALMLGAIPRIIDEGRWVYSWLLGLGAVLLALTRMYEGLLFVIPILLTLVLKRARFKVWLLSGAIAALGGAFVLYYNLQVTGHATELPYIAHQRQYGYAPYFSFQGLQPETQYRHENLFNLSHGWEFQRWQESRSLQLFRARGKDWYTSLSNICGGTFTVVVLCLLFLPAWRQRKWLLPFACVCLVVAGSLVETIFYTHYAAPATVAILLLTVCTFQQLRYSRFGGPHMGRFLSRGVPAAAFLLLMGTEGVRLYKHEPVQATKPVNARKQILEDQLREQKGGKHLILVRYTKEKVPHEEWIYNRADIEASDMVWAHDMGPVENAKIIEHFKGRMYWLMKPDDNPDLFEPYTEITPTAPPMSQ